MCYLRFVFGGICYDHFRQLPGIESHIALDHEGIQKFCPEQFVHLVLIYNFCLFCGVEFEQPEEPLAVPTLLADFSPQPLDKYSKALPTPTRYKRQSNTITTSRVEP
jgi:hypothetical protein